ncbi:MAG: tyrosine-protein kinase family protein [Colwellia sp.]|nr:tyrosine-protein kinase family protein [Colwellia sp.]
MSTIEKALAKQKLANQQLNHSVQDDVVEKAPSITIENTLSNTNNDVLQLDKAELERRGFLIDNGTRKSIKDEFRQIKRKLIANAFGPASKTLKHSNLVMVSSSKPNEGKTFISINLALSIALEQDKTVLLIDADVLRPSINRELGFGPVPGLVEYLLGKKNDISEILYSTNIDKLKIIPAGEPHHLSNELLASDRMEALAKELAERYPDRIVIFDCPPLIGVSETLVLANLMGQALVVIEESKTQLADIKTATENLNEDLALGLVLNKAIRSHKDMYGYYGYGYGTK